MAELNIATLDKQNEILGKLGIVGKNHALFLDDGIFNVPPDVSLIWVTACGAGGGGAGGECPQWTSSGGARGKAGQGGGAGEVVYNEPFYVLPGSTITIVVGKGGKGGQGKAHGAGLGENGTAGGATIIGNLLTLSGGSAGMAASNSIATNHVKDGYGAKIVEEPISELRYRHGGSGFGGGGAGGGMGAIVSYKTWKRGGNGGGGGAGGIGAGGGGGGGGATAYESSTSEYGRSSVAGGQDNRLGMSIYGGTGGTSGAGSVRGHLAGEDGQSVFGALGGQGGPEVLSDGRSGNAGSGGDGGDGFVLIQW